MLHELHVRGLALIDEAWLELGSGMTVVTGETGAGKTVLLGALKLLLGERADSTAVRAGEADALVEARFGFNGEDLLVVRRVTADGRSRCRLDGALASVGELAERVGPLVDLHGQHEHQALLSPSTHARYLDAWEGVRSDDALAAYTRARSEYREAGATLAELLARIDESRRDADYLRFVLGEIETVGPRAGEDDELEARLPSLRHAEALAEAAGSAAASLRAEGGAADQVARAHAALERVTGIDPALDGLAAQLAEIAVVIDDAGTSARAYRDRVEHDPRVLEASLARLAELSGLKRRYGPSLDEVIARADEARVALAAADESDAAIASAEQRREEARAGLVAAAEHLSATRAGAVDGFARSLEEATADLGMAGARFEVALTPLPFDSWTSEGAESVEFRYAPAPGQPARPLAKIASGGEVSRVMLALKSVLGAADAVETLVFDEVDAGIGGETAHAVGRRLAQLARRHQVVVVTHLAQVAAYADAHVVVSKEVGDDTARTRVAAVTGQQRVAEIARMLAGEPSPAALTHAEELLRVASARIADGT